MEPRKILGQNLRRLRTAKGWTQERLALEAGMNLSYLNNIENGHRNPGVLTIIKIARTLEVKIAELFDGIDGIG